MLNSNWQPRIVAFFCSWCTYTAADLAGVSRFQYAPNIRIIRLMCSSRVDPQFVLAALAGGADGVLIGGCHPGDCHYGEGNFKTMRRHRMLLRVLTDLGVPPDRLQLTWISASEAEQLKKIIDEMVGKIRALGPLNLPARFAACDAEISEPAEAVRLPQFHSRQITAPEVTHVQT